jgi:2-isopropylmalate synthase
MNEQKPVSISHFQGVPLMYDWNQVPPLICQFERPEQVELDDETLRDGLQCPSVLQPTLEQKQAFLHLLPRLGIGSADIGCSGWFGRIIFCGGGAAPNISDDPA